MASLTRRRSLRWMAAPVLAAAFTTAVLTSQTSASAADHPRLPARTAAQLLTAVEQQVAADFSGTVKLSARLGLPSLPDSFANTSGLPVQSLLTGTHTLRVWAHGADQQRVALLRGLAETDVVHNNADVWTYDSVTMQATHAALSSHADQQSATSRTMAETPTAVADQALKAIDPSTSVTVDRTARVAGRSAYQLVLQPRDARTLVARVQIAIDSKTSLPLRVQVFGRHASRPAVDVGFSSISFNAPKASIFRFTPPKGAKVQPANVSTLLGAGPGSSDTRGPDKTVAPPSAVNSAPRVLGTGWTAVVEIAAGRLDKSTSQLLDDMSRHVQGGRLITTALASVLVTDDGRILAGSVRGSDLETVALTGHGL